MKSPRKFEAVRRSTTKKTTRCRLGPASCRCKRPWERPFPIREFHRSREHSTYLDSSERNRTRRTSLKKRISHRATENTEQNFDKRNPTSLSLSIRVWRPPKFRTV